MFLPHASKCCVFVVLQEMEDRCRLTLHFLDEAAGSDESWSLKLGTNSTVKAVVSAIRIPWEQLFSVPLQVLNKSI
jgi:hypothetical protein